MKLFKTLLTILFISLLSSPSWSVTLGDLVEREGIYYQKFTDVPFTGEVTGQEQGSFKNGKRDGAWVGYNEDGQLWYEGKFKSGKQEGASVGYHDNGWGMFKGNYISGNQEGAWVGYYADGTVNKEGTGTFKDGVKISD